MSENVRLCVVWYEVNNTVGGATENYIGLSVFAAFPNPSRTTGSLYMNNLSVKKKILSPGAC